MKFSEQPVNQGHSDEGTNILDHFFNLSQSRFMEVTSEGPAPRAPPPAPPPRKLRCQDCELFALEVGGGAPLSTWKAPKVGFWKWKTSLKLMRCMACERTYQRCKKKKQRKVSHSLRDSRRARAPRRLHSYVRAPAPARRAAAKIYAPRSCPQCVLSTRPSRMLASTISAARTLYLNSNHRVDRARRSALRKYRRWIQWWSRGGGGARGF